MNRSRKVLLIDDEPAFTSMLRLNLEQTGRYLVRDENSARSGLEAAITFHPDVVLLDVAMPDMDGGDVARSLREQPTTRDIPVIFLTVLVGDEETPYGGHVSGGHRYLPKPVSVAEVIDCIEQVLLGDQKQG